MYWKEYFDRLTEHENKHKKNIRIQQNHQLGACITCFEVIGIKEITTENFWTFFKQICPETVLITSKGLELIEKLLNKIQEEPQSAKDIHNLSKAIVLAVQYQQTPTVPLETLVRRIAKTVSLAKTFEESETLKQIYIAEESERWTPSPINFF